MRRCSLAPVLCLLVLAPCAAQTPEPTHATLDYLRGLQSPEGGFLPDTAGARPSLRATSSALRALKYFGGEAKDRDAAARFILQCFDADTGTFADHPKDRGTSDVATTSVGIMAVVEVKAPLEPYRAGVLKYLGEHARTFEEIRIAAAGVEALGTLPPQAQAWREQLSKLRHEDGSFGKGDGAARDSGGAVAALLRVGATLDHPEQCVSAIRTGQRADGGFGKAGAAGSDLESCYRVTRALVMLKEKPADVVQLRAFVARCRNTDGGYGVTPGQSSSVAATYYASILRHWLNEQ